MKLLSFYFHYKCLTVLNYIKRKGKCRSDENMGYPNGVVIGAAVKFCRPVF